MPLQPDELASLSATTLDDYNQNAEGFRENTRDHDVSQNIEAFLRHIQGPRHWPSLISAAGRARPAHVPRPGPRAGGAGRCRALRRDGAGGFRVRGVAAVVPRPAIAGGALRWRVRQCHAVPRAGAGAAAGAAPAARDAEAGRGAVQLQPARGQPGRLERQPLWRLARLPGLEGPGGGGGFRGAGALLPGGPAAEQQPWVASVWRRSAAVAPD